MKDLELGRSVVGFACLFLERMWLALGVRPQLQISLLFQGTELSVITVTTHWEQKTIYISGYQ